MDANFKTIEELLKEAQKRNQHHADYDEVCKVSELIDQALALLAKHRWIPRAEGLPKRPLCWGKEINVIINGRAEIIKYYGLRIGMTHWKPIILPDKKGGE